MSTNSAIEWTESTWNPLTGCTKISPGCKHCYAERMALRLQAMGQPNYANGFQLTLHEHVLPAPLGWKKPQMIFVNSMSDLFHRDVPVDFIQQVFAVMRQAHWHTFQVLTKRSERLLELDDEIDWPDNVWMGVSVERQEYTFRIDHLRQTGARIKFLSLEPLLGPLPALDLAGIDWVILGGKSGPGAQAARPELGSPRCAISAWPQACRSSSSSGAVCARSVPVECSMDGRGTVCRQVESPHRSQAWLPDA